MGYVVVFYCRNSGRKMSSEEEKECAILPQGLLYEEFSLPHAVLDGIF